MAVPLIEVWVIIQIGQVIGPWWTILLLLADGALGTWLVKREGGRAWRALTTALQSGRMPARELADGILVLIGGTLMLAPGFVTDLFALALILPVTRPVGRRLLTGFITRRIGPAGPAYGGAYGPTSPGHAHRPGDGEVIRGDVVE